MKPTLLRSAALITSVTLAGSYVYYRAVANDPPTSLASADSAPATSTAPARPPTTILPGSKAGPMSLPIPQQSLPLQSRTIMSSSKSVSIVKPQDFQNPQDFQLPPEMQRTVIMSGSKSTTGIITVNPGSLNSTPKSTTGLIPVNPASLNFSQPTSQPAAAPASQPSTQSRDIPGPDGTTIHVTPPAPRQQSADPQPSPVVPRSLIMSTSKSAGSVIQVAPNSDAQQQPASQPAVQRRANP